MNLLLGLQIGLKEIWAHKFRSFLTMLGVILGVASLLSMFAITEGMARGMREVMQATGGIERVQVVPKEVSEQLQDIAFLSPGRTLNDVEALETGAPSINLVSPESNLGGAAVTRGNQTTRLNVTGTGPSFAEMGNFQIERGRPMSQLDLDGASHVVMLGNTVADELFRGVPGSPLGQLIWINGRPFTVIGIFPFYETEAARKQREAGVSAAIEERRKARRGTPAPSRNGRPASARPSAGGGGGNRWDPFGQKNRAVVIPITTMFYEFKSALDLGGGSGVTGTNYKLDALVLRVSDVTQIDQALAQVRTVLDRTHRGVDDFGFDTREDWFDNIEKGVSAARTSGSIIAGISLLVGGIGIANIMLASITERIREIGVRRAIGARARDIFSQILIESMVVGVIGGLLGLVASQGVLKLAQILSPANNAPAVTPGDVLISFSCAVFIGIVSGIYPAWKASRLDPIEALRYG